jgi:O-antigen/teichoic acid export membrane protein
MNKKVISSGLWFTISNFIVRSIGFITTPIFARMLTKAEFGDYSNFAAWASLALVVTSLNLEASLMRARFDYEKHLNDYAFSMIVLSTLSTICWYLLFVIFSGFFSDWLEIDKVYIHSMFIYLIFYPAINIFQTMERFRYKYKWNVFISMTVALSTSLLSVILVLTMKNGLAGRIIGFVVPPAIVGFLIILYYMRSKCRLSTKYWKYAVPFTLPFIPHLLSMNLLSNMDRIMVKKYCGSEELALYSLAYTCGTIISILVVSINSAYSPWLAEKLTQKDYAKVKKVSVPYVMLFVYFSIAAALLIPEILLILGGKKYSGAMQVLPPVAASTILQFVYCMYVNVEQYEKKTQMMAAASVFAMLSNYILNYIFIPEFGFIVAAYTTYASYFILMLLHMLIVRIIKRSMVYSNTSIIIITALSSAVIFSTTFLLEHIVIRYIIIAVYGAIGLSVMWKYRDHIKQFLERKKQ